MSKSVDKQAAIDEVQYEIEMINHALDSLTLDYNTREKLHQRKEEAREILNSIETLPAVNPEPQKIGKWIHKGNRHTCPFCETSFTSNSAEVKNAHRYCYYCGARLE